jgi:hypothetical protein
MVMTDPNRRQFLADVGRGVLATSIGASFCTDLGLGTVRADEKPKELTFGKLEPLVCLLQETPPAKLLPLLVKRIQEGTDVKELIAATALANARTFGGEDYVGFHTMMALSPAFHMAREMPAGQTALPVLKVLYRNAENTQKHGGRKGEVLHPVEPVTLPKGVTGHDRLFSQVKAKKMDEAEGTFAALAQGGPDKALDELLYSVQDSLEVHRVVLPYRAWDLLPIVGKEHAHTLLRQSVRYCVKSENPQWNHVYDSARKILPRLLERALTPKERLAIPAATEDWLSKFSQTIFGSAPDDAATAVAEALSEGFSAESVGEAISLAANQLTLRDNGRPKNQTSPNKPEGSIHGDSIGVHACDSANAWRNLARAAGKRNQAACLILAAWQVAHDRKERGGDFLNWEPYPRSEARARVKGTEAKALLDQAEDAIRHKDQPLAAAAVAAYGEKGYPARAVFDLLLRYAVSEDGALHAEKYYRTVSEEFAITRPAFRWRQLVALARVTASAFGFSAPGHADACKLLKA